MSPRHPLPVFLRAAALASLVIFGGCATKNAFNKAKKAGTSQAWSRFLAENPKASKAQKEEAVRLRDDTLWAETVTADNAEAYLSFIKRNRQHHAVPEAKKRLGRLLSEGKSGEDVYTEFFSIAPSAPDEVRKGLEKVRFNGLKEARDPHAYALFMSQYPGSLYAERLGPAVRRSELKEAESIGTRLAYQFFLKRYPPPSGDADKANKKLAQLESGAPPNGTFDLDKLLPRLRRSEPILIRHECRKNLEAELKKEPNLYGARAENIRDQIRQVAASGSNPPRLCAGRGMVPDDAGRGSASNAVRALAVLMQRQQDLSNIFTAPDKLAHDAQEIGSRSAAMSEDAETQELELEALYGSMPADPKNPDDTASKNAKEAGRRAKRAWDLTRGLSNPEKKAAAAEVLRLMDRQKDLLLEIIAYYEKPAAAAEAEDPTQ